MTENKKEDKNKNKIQNRKIDFISVNSGNPSAVLVPFVSLNGEESPASSITHKFSLPQSPYVVQKNKFSGNGAAVNGIKIGRKPIYRNIEIADMKMPDTKKKNTKIPDTKISDMGILYEVRSSALSEAPGEVSFPGGHMENGENPETCAVRETCEELLVSSESIKEVRHIAVTCGPGLSELDVCVGNLEDYRGTFSKSEVKDVFIVPVRWFLNNPPRQYRASFKTVTDRNFPERRITGKENYKWSEKPHDIYVYEYEGHVIWGVTARITRYIINNVNYL